MPRISEKLEFIKARSVTVCVKIGILFSPVTNNQVFRVNL